MPSPDAHAPRLIDLDLPGLRLHAAVQGEGPLVILCHGFPEGWRSWRHQLAALAAAGYRAVAPDLRGYGGTEALGGPLGPEQTTMLHHAGDLVALVKALGETQAVLVGHDWGAPTVWYAALMRPDVFRAVAGLAVPFVPPSPVDLLTAYARQGVDRFYMQYFQAPGVAEAELNADPEATLRRVWWSMSGDGPGRVVAGVLPPGAGFLDVTEEPDPSRLPAWWHADDLQATAEDFRRRGFVGGLNWYRAIRRNAELLAPWYGAVIRQPSLFIVGECDDLLAFPGVRERLQDLRRALPGLRGQHVLPGAGHWVQRERADEVSGLLVDFLRGLDGPASPASCAENEALHRLRSTMPSTVSFHRVLRCPPARLFRAFTQAEALAKWLPPHGYTGQVHQLEPTVGGRWHMAFTHLGSGHSHGFGGEYLAVEPDRLLRYTSVFDDPQLPGTMVTTLTLTPVVCGTELHAEQSGIPDGIPPALCHLGWQESQALLALLVEAEVPGG